MFTDIPDLKHKDAIVQFFELLFWPGMTPEEKIRMVNDILEATDMTIKLLDEAIETGVQNGHSVEYQLALIAKLIDLRFGGPPDFGQP